MIQASVVELRSNMSEMRSAMGETFDDYIKSMESMLAKTKTYIMSELDKKLETKFTDFDQRFEAIFTEFKETFQTELNQFKGTYFYPLH